MTCPAFRADFLSLHRLDVQFGMQVDLCLLENHFSLFERRKYQEEKNSGEAVTSFSYPLSLGPMCQLANHRLYTTGRV